MNWETFKKVGYWVVAAAIIAAGFTWLVNSGPARAADLGGNCCADLEERIAELEATTTRKGNRKVSLKVYGEVNKALRFEDWDAARYAVKWNGTTSATWNGSGSRSEDVIDNSASPSLVGFAGDATIGDGWKAGYVLEIGVGGFDDSGTNDIYTYRSFVWVESRDLGKVSVGLASQATDDLDLIDTSNAGVARRPLSVRPVTGPQVGEVADLFDGTRADLVRYDSPIIGGFRASASWASGNDDGDVWDVALRYAGAFEQVRIAAGVGYRHGLVVNGSGPVNDDVLDIDVFTAVLSVKHVPSGIFVTGNYGRLDGDIGLVPFDGDAWAVTGGIERKLFNVGQTTFFAEHGDGALDARVSLPFPGWSISAGGEATYYGGGIVQNFEAAALDLYANVRFYEFDGDVTLHGPNNTLSLEASQDATVGTVGARIKF